MYKLHSLSAIRNNCAIAPIIRYFLIRKLLAGYWQQFRRIKR
ncbi:hypothetical protein [Coleofasciculus sp. G2-EDA-02]